MSAKTIHLDDFRQMRAKRRGKCLFTSEHVTTGFCQTLHNQIEVLYLHCLAFYMHDILGFCYALHDYLATRDPLECVVSASHVPQVMLYGAQLISLNGKSARERIPGTSPSRLQLSRLPTWVPNRLQG